MPLHVSNAVREAFKNNNSEVFFLISKASLRCSAAVVVPVVTLEVCCSCGRGRDPAAWPGRRWHVLNVLKDINNYDS